MTERKPVGYRYPELADEAWLRGRHHDEGLAANQIAELIGCSQAAARTALARHGLYRPQHKRSPRVLLWVTPHRILRDAKTVPSWWALGRLYGVQPSMIHIHANALGIHAEVEAALGVRRSVAPSPLPANSLLESRDWIAVSWARHYSMKQVAADALVTTADMRRWLRVHGMSVVELREARDWAIQVEYRAGGRLAQVARWHGLDAAAVWRILHRSGMVTTGRRPSAAVYTGYEEWMRSTSTT